ncbi:unnamed protein product, partial [Mesorhabditis spiculigera]
MDFRQFELARSEFCPGGADTFTLRLEFRRKAGGGGAVNKSKASTPRFVEPPSRELTPSGETTDESMFPEAVAVYVPPVSESPGHTTGSCSVASSASRGRDLQDSRATTSLERDINKATNFLQRVRPKRASTTTSTTTGGTGTFNGMDATVCPDTPDPENDYVRCCAHGTEKCMQKRKDDAGLQNDDPLERLYTALNK